MILICDIDGTLCESRPVVGSFEEWEASIIADHPEPHPKAARILSGLLERHRPSAVLLLTARHERLREVTRRFLGAHFPVLAMAPLSMQTTAEYEAWKVLGESVQAGFSWSRRSKMSRLAVWRARLPPSPAILLDDDPDMAAACHRDDAFVRAWWISLFQAECEAQRKAGEASGPDKWSERVRRLEAIYTPMVRSLEWVHVADEDADRARDEMQRARALYAVAQHTARKVAEVAL